MIVTNLIFEPNRIRDGNSPVWSIKYRLIVSDLDMVSKYKWKVIHGAGWVFFIGWFEGMKDRQLSKVDCHCLIKDWRHRFDTRSLSDFSLFPIFGSLNNLCLVRHIKQQWKKECWFIFHAMHKNLRFMKNYAQKII